MLNFIYALLLAIIAAVLINYFYKRHSAKSKMLQTTVTPPLQSSQSQAKLILKEKHEFIIKEYERVFGREDFVGVLVADDLLFIGKKHFKISKKDDGFYIKDLKTKNGTKINSKDLKGHESVRLHDGDNILVADVLNIRYTEEMI
ncbi:MAG TPA: FHA domain-containing protein [Methanobacterium subterraneum]|uniref:FHA domain-containing protein n=1 Tax=Methanobacterium subterraneum TaxID=59277 RepID=A0A7J4TNP6_9EURY|nr:FHA domain-containing protein [Methanobacterium subterraneum]